MKQGVPKGGRGQYTLDKQYFGHLMMLERGGGVQNTLFSYVAMFETLDDA